MLGLRVCEIRGTVLKSRVPISYSSLAVSEGKAQWFTKPDILVLPGAGPPGLGARYGAWMSYSLGRTSVVV